ncbi:MAG: endonuclease domain-containing protein [Bacteroidaceae bacterium]|nr:endonuclease domain-containing protein [Bacteroidaceae bacterium]MBQ8455634.1 endonuclease domain-containing protein [Bacteroidaceae bacterium]MBQ9294479.1 endonuclease domain-containing protein [Bacteroidaceae bacterium]MBQ9294508.1 endonuclease domain-containing protein [Bacteroidaceae bacterium]
MTKFDRHKANYCYSDPALYPILKEHAKRMRNLPTDAERILWMYLKQEKFGKPFRRQHIIASSIADFVCLPARLVIEIDGKYHDDIRQQYHDQLRTEDIEKLGFRVIRFTNEDIFTKLDNVLETIKNNIS